MSYYVYLFQENKSYGSKKNICIHPLVYEKLCWAQLILAELYLKDQKAKSCYSLDKK